MSKASSAVACNVMIVDFLIFYPVHHTFTATNANYSYKKANTISLDVPDCTSLPNLYFDGDTSDVRRNHKDHALSTRP